MRTERPDVLTWLKREGMSQTDWAMKIGVSLITIQNWVHRGTEPSSLARDLIVKHTPSCPLLKHRKYQ